MILGRKLISPLDARKYTVDYSDWLDTTETLDSVAFSVDTGPAAVTSHTVSGDGKSVVFLLSGAVLASTPFNLLIAATTSASQVKNDHVEFDVVAS